jgi:hypothetical protein
VTRDKIIEARNDLREAESLGAPDTELNAVRQLLATAYVKQAEDSEARGDVKGIRVACDAAERYQAPASAVSRLRALAFKAEGEQKKKSGDLAGALKAFTEALKLNRRLGLQTERAELHVKLGERAVANQDNSTAATELAAAISLDKSATGVSALAGSIAEPAVVAFEQDPTSTNQRAAIAAWRSVSQLDATATTTIQLRDRLVALLSRPVFSFEQAPSAANEKSALAAIESISSVDALNRELPGLRKRVVLKRAETVAAKASDAGPAEAAMALSGREKAAKKTLLVEYGGTAATEAAVKNGLEWLERNQFQNGTWSLSGPFEGGVPGEKNRVAATAMAMLAFQGAGHTHTRGEYRDVMKRAMEALVGMQDKDGNFFRVGRNHSRLYSQAQATIAVCELYAMTMDAELREVAQKAINYAVKVQAPEGGWRYEPNIDSDVSVSGWFMMALQSGKMAGLDVPSPTLDRLTKFLDSTTTDGGINYSYKVGERAKVSMTAEALLCRQYLGWKRSDERLIEGVDVLLTNPVDYGDENVYYWYYASQVLHHMGGKQWDRWNKVMRQAIPNAQLKTGAERGSWSPDADLWGARGGGRLFTTCLSIYNLEVYYRHLPIYRH